MEGYRPVSDGLAAVYTRNRPQDPDKKVRREIANSNERRRMQSINAGYDNLKNLIPHHDGEKLSKSAILQHTSEHIMGLEEEKAKLIAQNDELIATNATLKRLLIERDRYPKQIEFTNSPPPKRKKRDTESSDEGISMGSSPDSNEDSIEDLKSVLMELRGQLDSERWCRSVLEKRVQSMEAQMYPEKLSDVSNACVQTDINKMTNEFVEVKTCDEPIKDIYNARYNPVLTSKNNLSLLLDAAACMEYDPMGTDANIYDERVPNGSIHPRRITHSHPSTESEKDCSDQENKSDNSDQEVPTYTHRIFRHRLQKKHPNEQCGIYGQTTNCDKYSTDILQIHQNQYYPNTEMLQPTIPSVIVHTPS